MVLPSVIYYSTSKQLFPCHTHMLFCSPLLSHWLQVFHHFVCLIKIPPMQCHEDVIEWKHFPLYWLFVRRIHRSPVNSPHKGQWRGALMFSLICAWINGWVNNDEAGDLRRHRAHYDINVMALRPLNHCPHTQSAARTLYVPSKPFSVNQIPNTSVSIKIGDKWPLL